MPLSKLREDNGTNGNNGNFKSTNCKKSTNGMIFYTPPLTNICYCLLRKTNLVPRPPTVRQKRDMVKFDFVHAQ